MDPKGWTNFDRRLDVTARHNLPVCPNLARGFQPAAINQLWVADITYIRLRTEFVCLAVVLDAFSRRVIGWALGRTLEAGLAVAALRMALMERHPAPGLVHHSDRGVQYASGDYTELRKQNQAAISMSRKGNPHANRTRERRMEHCQHTRLYGATSKPVRMRLLRATALPQPPPA